MLKSLIFYEEYFLLLFCDSMINLFCMFKKINGSKWFALFFFLEYRKERKLKSNKRLHDYLPRDEVRLDFVTLYLIC